MKNRQSEIGNRQCIRGQTRGEQDLPSNACESRGSVKTNTTSLLTDSNVQRSIPRRVVKSGRKWVQPRSNTDHEFSFPLGHPPMSLALGR